MKRGCGIVRLGQRQVNVRLQEGVQYVWCLGQRAANQEQSKGLRRVRTREGRVGESEMACVANAISHRRLRVTGPCAANTCSTCRCQADASSSFLPCLSPFLSCDAPASSHFLALVCSLSVHLSTASLRPLDRLPQHQVWTRSQYYAYSTNQHSRCSIARKVRILS